MRRTAASAGALVAPLAASLAIGLAGCTTPVLKSSVEVPGAVRRGSRSPRTSPRSPGGKATATRCCPTSIRRAARENRDVKIAAERVRAARAGETISRSWLLPSISAVGARASRTTPATARPPSRSFPTSRRRRRRRRFVGNRSLRPPARGRGGGRGRRAGGRTRRARRAPAGADRRRDATTSRWSARCASSRPCARSRRRRTRRCAWSRRASAPGLATPFDVERAQTDARERARRSRRSRRSPPSRGTASRC